MRIRRADKVNLRIVVCDIDQDCESGMKVGRRGI